MRCCCVCFVVLVPLAAQHPDVLVGLDSQMRRVTCAPGSCAVQARTAPLPIPPAASSYTVEVAWDATRHRVWVQSLNLLAAFDPATGALLEGPVDSGNVFSGGGVAGGLAVVES